MADRGRGGRGGSGGNGRGRGGGRAGGDDKPKREAILDLAKFADKRVRVKFMGGREITGILKGYDQLLNLVMDEVEEIMRVAEEGSLASNSIPAEPEGATVTSPPKTRSLGLAVIRGTSLVVINPVDGYEEIANPFINQQ
ncbi:small nuclear ribonucleoprotein [Puccinia sorghi]|uniref:Small nuclear ribonucleoprotein n=1 Tax=Puccinia sorghi TaxID=27349 RepID=A0A0L6VQI2_9BASI|nr:small nuclear ribonucleoprotein [Puccinia sorghi]